jgi:drug/metabolite transporter (DMT)-like permease
MLSNLSTAALARRAAHWSPTTRGLLWVCGAGFLFSLLNTLMRVLALQVDPFQSQFLRYFFGLVLLLPIVLHRGVRAFWPRQVGGQFARGACHTAGLCLWFIALPKIPLADMTAIGFTTPLFVMIGAYVFFREAMRWERWAATAVGFSGVLIVVGPQLMGKCGAATLLIPPRGADDVIVGLGALSGSGGGYHLVMLASAPIFAASFLLTKALTRYEGAGVILVWQALTVSLFSLPLALLHWQALLPLQWAQFALCGLLGSAGHYCLTRSFAAADISATQSAKFLDLIWSALLGWLVFTDAPSHFTLAGGALICAATIWVARRESRDAPVGAAADERVV